VRIGRPRDFTPPRTHLFTRVELDGISWLADVGVGGLTPTAAMRLELNVEQTTLHEPHRIIRQGDLYFHQALLGEDWSDVCEFTLEEMPLIDREVANWYTCAHPQSHFKEHLVVAKAGPAGKRLTILDNAFSIRNADGKANKHTMTSEKELFQVLDEHFGLRFAPELKANLPNFPWLLN
jgi:N-hydroxyarylamine O-acetyltransferase